MIPILANKYGADNFAWLQKIIQKDDTIEIRAINIEKNKVKSAYINQSNIQQVLQSVIKHNQQNWNIYIGVSLLDSACYPPSSLQRRNRYIRSQDIKRRRILAIDIDPVRKSHNGKKIFANGDLKNYTLQYTHQVRKYLTESGIKSAFAKSGNGFYLLCLLSEADGQQQIEKDIKSIVHHLDIKFSNNRVKIDQSVTNDTSLIRLFGSLNHCYDKKGKIVSLNTELNENIPEALQLKKTPIYMESTRNKIVTNPKRSCTTPINRAQCSVSNSKMDLSLFLVIVQDTIDLGIIYGDFLLDRTTTNGDQYCVDPFHQGSNAIGCVSNGGKHRRGRFYSFASNTAMSPIEFYSRVQGIDYINACIQISQLSGIEIPKEGKNVHS